MVTDRAERQHDPAEPDGRPENEARTEEGRAYSQGPALDAAEVLGGDSGPRDQLGAESERGTACGDP